MIQKNYDLYHVWQSSKKDGRVEFVTFHQSTFMRFYEWFRPQRS